MIKLFLETIDLLMGLLQNATGGREKKILEAIDATLDALREEVLAELAEVQQKVRDFPEGDPGEATAAISDVLARITARGELLDALEDE